MESETKILTAIGTGVVAVFTGLVALGMWGCPQYSVYSKRKSGEATLAEAQSSREVVIAEARAKMESADLLAQAELTRVKTLAAAEVERAKGVAEANKIIGESLKGNEGYLRYLWVSGLKDNNPTVIYVPTEAGLPILEAGKAPRP